MKKVYVAIALWGILGLLPSAGLTQKLEESVLITQNNAQAAALQANDRANALYNQGTAESLREAIAVWEEALLLWREIGDTEWIATTLNNIGFVYNRLGERDNAIARFNEVLEIANTTQDESSEATALLNLGFVYSGMGDKRQALDLYQQSLAIWQKLDNISGQATTLNNIGNIYQFLGKYDAALEYLTASVPLLEQLEDDYRLALTFVNIGTNHSDRGEKQEALNYFERALSLTAATQNPSARATILNNMGAVYDDLGDNEQALKYYQDSLALLQTIADRNREAITLTNIGAIYSDSKQTDRAIANYTQALEILTAVGDRYGQAITLSNIGSAYSDIQEYEQALSFLNRALTQLQAVNNPLAIARSKQQIANVYYAQDNRDRALEFYNQALVEHRAVGDRYSEARTLAGIARVYRESGDLEAALASIQSAISIIEELRIGVTSPDLRTSFFANNQDFYEFYIDLLMELHQQQPQKGYDAQALHINERARARSLLELLTEANTNIRKGVDPELLHQEQQLQQQLSQIEANRVALFRSEYSPTAVAELEANRIDTLEQYQQVQDQIRATSPNYAALTQPQPLTLAEIQEQILDDDTLLLQYALGEERSFLWLVSKTEINSYILPPRSEIKKSAQQFYQRLQNPSFVLGSDRGALGVQPRLENEDIATLDLSQVLLEPIAAKLANRRLLIVSDGALQYIPFAALTLPGSDRPLILDREIVNLPSTSTLSILRSQPPTAAPKQIAILADPVFSDRDSRLSTPVNPSTIAQAVVNRAAQTTDVDLQRLPGTRAEAQAILSLIPENRATVAFDFQANRDFVTQTDISQYRILHFATHGILNSNYPELSGIVLSLVDAQGNPQNGFLRLHDIYNLDLQAELVVLSACQTGLGQEIKGEGLVGLTRGFMYAGTPRAIVSLWNVDDQATAEMMSRFYRLLIQEKLPAIAALRQAQIEMQTETPWQNPYYWAAFTLQGEWQ
ncbi:MAG: CHAT domain-containing tetratricopeptide repeat protein [Jaaginema sp. PMC 1079.18]|nr:CHAT domain-containing tetratricopeptide repeat protein [Jaaginema sp. PMC 1080.18]MEC4850293.1 CHAT domain-containing tetratricopeptide repeat protein [Jaaginema sp. PMC 1079.18]MEC4867384.1 CHAT domain-containing tetratricopeptide repeat protein [Jaaginema sp. PMC 1078.18]